MKVQLDKILKKQITDQEQQLLVALLLWKQLFGQPDKPHTHSG